MGSTQLVSKFKYLNVMEKKIASLANACMCALCLRLYVTVVFVCVCVCHARCVVMCVVYACALVSHVLSFLLFTYE